MNLDIKGLRVLVTAGANGIGLAIARAFVREGARVIVNGRTPQSVDAAIATAIVKGELVATIPQEPPSCRHHPGAAPTGEGLPAGDVSVLIEAEHRGTAL